MAGDGRRQQGVVQKGHVAPEKADDSEDSLTLEVLGEGDI